MGQPIRVLHLEDNPRDAELIAARLNAEGSMYAVVLATGQKSFESLVTETEQRFDVVLCDYNIWNYDGLAAVRFVHKARPDTPVIVLSGILGDEAAVECLKAGATDFVLKHNLPRLTSAITRALAETSEHRKLVAAQRALVEAERFARSTLDALSSHIAILDEDGRILAVNQAWKDFAKSNPPAPKAEAIGANYLAVCDEAYSTGDETAAAFAAGIREVMRGELASFSMEYACHSPEQKRWFNGRVTRFKGNGPVRVVVAHENITERKWAEERLQASERRFSDLFEFSPDATVITNQAGIIVQANSRVPTMFGWTPAELVGQPIEVLIPSDLRTSHPNLRERYLESALPRAMGGGDAELLGLRKDGSVFPVDISLSPMETQDGLMLAAAVRDVTERQKVMKELQSLAEELQHSNTTIETERALLVERVAERTAELADANSELIRASRAKSDFLSTMSHELRTPLNGILGMNELLLATDLTDRQRQYVAACNSSGKILVQLVNDILDLSKIEAGKLELDLRECDLESLIYDIAEIMAHVVEAKGLVLQCRLAPEASIITKCDDNRLRQILVNLIGNAIKFTSSGVITVTLDRVAERDGISRLRFAVSDTGVGIPPERLDRLFKPFSQVDSSTTRQFGGTGLGLSICKQLVELMGGQIGVESKAGVGTTFWFETDMEISKSLTAEERRRRLLVGKRILAIDGLDRERLQVAECLQMWNCPFKHVATVGEGLAAAQDASVAGVPFNVALADCRLVTGNEFNLLQKLAAFPNLQVIALGAPRDELSREHLQCLGIHHVLIDPIRPSNLFNALANVLSVTNGKLPDKNEHTTRSGQPEVQLSGHILVAEDNRINQLYIVELLKHFGCTSDVAVNGEEALAAVEQQRYDLVLMDCQMPEMDGLSATREIRKREASGELAGRTPILALTANALKGDRERCIATGMDDYISKPLEAKTLRETLAKFLQ